MPFSSLSHQNTILRGGLVKGVQVNIAYSNPDYIMGLTDPYIMNEFYSIFDATQLAITEFDRLLSRSEVSSALQSTGSINTIGSEGQAIRVDLIANSNTNALIMRCIGCGANNRMLSFPGQPFTGDTARYPGYVGYMKDKINRAKALMAQMNPYTTNGKALLQDNKTYLIYAKAKADRNKQNGIVPPAGTGTSPRVINYNPSITLTGAQVIDPGGQIGKTAIITTSDGVVTGTNNVVLPATTIIVPVFSSQNDVGSAPVDSIPGCQVPFCPNKE